MSKYIHRFILHSIMYISLLLSSSLYAGEPPPVSKLTKADYLELCSIYKEVINKPIDLSSKEGYMVEKTQNRLPVLFNELYMHVINVDFKDRYKFISEYAVYHKKDWQCESAKLYYINGLKKEK